MTRRHCPRLSRARLLSGGACVAASLAAAALLPVQPQAKTPTRLITASAIGGVRLGLTQQQYTRLLGRPSFVTRMPRGVLRLAFAQGELQVYLSAKTRRGIAVLTPEAEFRTSKGVGPCSPLAAVQAAYGNALRVHRVAGHAVAYELGRLIFVAPAGSVTVVMLRAEGFPIATAVNSAACGKGDEG